MLPPFIQDLINEGLAEDPKTTRPRVKSTNNKLKKKITKGLLPHFGKLGQALFDLVL